MAEESDLSRTEPASARRLQEAREAGDVPRSPELAGWLVLLTALGVLAWQAPALYDALRAAATAAFSHAAKPLAPPFVEALASVLWALMPVLAALFIAALAAPMLLSGWVYAPQRTQADLARLHLFKPIARLFSAEGWFDGALTLMKLALIATAVGWTLASGWQALDDLEAYPGGVAGWLAQGVLALVMALGVAAALDAGWRWWRYLRRHAMTWQEVLAEAREAELPAEVQAQLRMRQQQAGQGGTAGSLGAASPSPFIQGAKTRPTSINEVIG